MKLINLRGTLKNGDAYKVSFKTYFNKVLCVGYFQVNVEVFDTFCEKWFWHCGTIECYRLDFGDKFEKALKTIEEKIDVQLLKGNLKVAV